MHFAQPEMLNVLWLLVPATALFWMLIGRKKKKIVNFVQPQLVENLMKNFSYPRYYLKFGLLILTFFCGIFALARPQWGFQWQEVKRQGIDILVVIDTSKSMLTTDVKPNRLERTKLAVKDLVKKLQGDRIGLIAFAGDAFLMCPLTVDYSGFMMTLDDLNTGSVPRGGTNVGRAIEEAMKSYDNTPSRYRAVIILTDGENLEGDPLKAAQDAQKKEVKLFCIGIGTQEGELIQVEDANGDKEFVKDEQGNFIKSRLNEDLLQKIAVATGGAYIRASGAQFGLDLIYDRELSKMEKCDFDSKKEKRYFERFQVPLVLAVLFIFSEGLLNPRVRRKILAGIILALLSQIWTAPVWAAPLAKEVNDANRLYREQEYAQALKKYQEALDKEPNSDIINFNLGTALYRNKKYPEALEHLQKALLTEDSALKEKAFFNLGNAYYRIGMNHEDTDINQAIADVEKALEQVNKALTINKDDKDAQHNRDFFESELRRLKRNKPSAENRQKQQQEEQKQDQQQNKAQGQDQTGSSRKDDEGGQDKDKQQPQAQEQSPAGAEQQQPSGAGEDKDKQQPMNASVAQGKEKDLRPEEVAKFLQQYQAGEEPAQMLNFGQKPTEEKPVLKDW